MAIDNNLAELDTQSLLPMPVAVDLIRFEKNLLQIGFFGAHDTRHNNQTTRRIEQWVVREGQKTRVSAEFRGSGALGLPSTSDRDKYIAFMKIAMDQKAKLGTLENPIRFTGYQMLKELGLSYSGENYEDINRWGQRMADATITSEQVIYLAARKRYANKTLHVFRSFVRAGKSNLDDTSRAEHYEVVLEDWLLENLNQSYVVPEDFNAYRCLRRPTAKGIFGYLHLWFHASQGRSVEKDYTELCILLNIPVYRHVSKIRETMGRSLDELSQIGYLSDWKIRPMVTKEGFKLVLQAGEKLLHVLAVSRRKAIEPASVPEAVPEKPDLNSRQKAAQEALLACGVSPAKAEELARSEDPSEIQLQIHHVRHLLRQQRGKISNPAGFLIYAIESHLPVPPTHVPAAQAPATSQANTESNTEHQARTRLEESYSDYISRQVEQEIARRFPGAERERQIRRIISNRMRHDARFAQIDESARRSAAEELMRREIGSQPGLLQSFDEWCRTVSQLPMFS